MNLDPKYQDQCESLILFWFTALIMGLFSTMLFSCAHSVDPLQLAKTPTFISKTGMMAAHRMEGTPVLWNGQLIFVVSNRNDVNNPKIEFYDGVSKALISSVDIDVVLPAAFVENGTMYLYGTTLEYKEIYLRTSSDLLTWSAPSTSISEVQDRALFNVSVHTDPTGYIMAYETCEPNTKCFSVRFKHSTDLIHWTDVGQIFGKDIYAACPTIRYVDGYYYVFYLRFFEHFSTVVNRSKDLIHWENDHMVLSPTDSDHEGENNSDMDLVEVNGQVVMHYVQGNQQSDRPEWMDVMVAKYNGTLSQFVKELFK